MCRKFLALAFFPLLFLTPGSRGAQLRDTLIVGDSLSKEYEFQGAFLWNSSQARKARNWMEILIALRGPAFNFGLERDGNPWNDVWPDSRFLGHEFNWAIPGSTTEDWRSMLEGGSVYQNFTLSRFNENVREDVRRAVVFLGGNDLNQVYTTYYNGANPDAFIARLLSNFQKIVAHLRNQRSDLQIVLANVPDVGATPDVQSDHPDPQARARVTALTETLNAALAQFAAQEGLGIADIHAFTEDYISPRVLEIGGVPLIKDVNRDNAPRYIFSADGFHPNTSAQALVANEIIRALNDTFGAGIIPLSGPEIIEYLEGRHGVDINVDYADWLAAYGLPLSAPADDSDADGVADGVEFALAMDPSESDPAPRPSLSKREGTQFLTLTWMPRAEAEGLVSIVPQVSTALIGWSDSGFVQSNADGSFTVEQPVPGGSLFLRLEVTVLP